MWKLYESALKAVSRFDANEWLIALVVVVIVGFFCMRGFGSRSGY